MKIKLRQELTEQLKKRVTTMLLTHLWLRDLFLGFRINMNLEKF